MRIIFNLVGSLDLIENKGMFRGLLSSFIEKYEKENLEITLYFSETALFALIIEENWIWEALKNPLLTLCLNATHLEIQSIKPLVLNLIKKKGLYIEKIYIIPTNLFYEGITSKMLDSDSRIITI